MTGQNNRPGVGSRAAENAFHGAPATLPDAAHAVTTTSRCGCCGRPTSAALSVARGLGPQCWARLRSAQAIDRAENVRVRLAALAERAGWLDARGVAIVAAGLADLEDAVEALGAAGVTS